MCVCPGDERALTWEPVTTITSNTALPAKGGEWIVDPGSSFDIISPSEVTASEGERIYALDNPVPLNTAQGEAVADKADPVQ